ncbi:Translation Initiation factor eIF- 4e [Dillenia turbinata]|uniref:mRNA cap-binding protein n=1 Tax=Dillenia turbinata TaxID=194707 RepID=A0AAN8UKP6_9MAGN
MMVEELARSASSTEVQNNANPSPRKPSPNSGEDSELEEGEIVDPDDSSLKQALSADIPHQPHPLENSWTFWFDNPSAKSKQATWGTSISRIYTFSTIEEFWGLHNNIHHPSKLAGGADLYCFKDKIEPKWEDPICANGGKWTVTFGRVKSDTCWLYTLLAMIGEQFDHGDEICGAVVNVRSKQEKIALWTKNASNEAAQVCKINLTLSCQCYHLLQGITNIDEHHLKICCPVRNR